MSLRNRLIITFLAISVAGTLITALIVARSNSRAFDQLLAQQGRDAFVRSAATHYRLVGSWDGFMPPSPAGDAAQPPPFALADAQGRVVFPGGPFLRGNLVPRQALAAGTPVLVDDRPVGTVLAGNQPPPRDPAADSFLRQTNRALLLGALGATVAALALALVLARTLIRPLRELAGASRRMAAGDLAQEVPVRTRDELGELAAAFNQMSAALAQATRQRRQLTADIAHDLRTPLTVLSGYLEAMEEGTLTPTPARLRLLQDEVGILNRLVADLRTLSLADAGTLTLNREAVAPAALLTAVADAHRHQAEAQGIDLVVEAPADMPAARLDPARMRQVLDNLVANSVRHTPAGGRITLGAARADDELLLTVADTGSGIEPADLPHIFDRFYRIDPSRRADQGASGLGLAIVRSLAEAHGGSVSADSRPGAGTRFTLRLPFNP